MGAIAPSCVTRERPTGEGWTGRIPLATPQTALSRRRPICLSCRHDRRRVTASTRRECARADSEGSHVFFFFFSLGSTTRGLDASPHEGECSYERRRGAAVVLGGVS